MAKKIKKTLSMRVLDGAGVSYDVIEFPEIIHDASEVATYAGETPDKVYKTLVAVRDKGKPLLVMVPSNGQLDLKKLAAAVGEKKIQMAKHDEAEKLTGLQVGGISALALLNKGFEVYIDQRASKLEYVLVSAGKRGLNLRLPVAALLDVTDATVIDAAELK